MMKKTFSIHTVRAISLATLIIGLSACEKTECTECPEEEAKQPAKLTLSIESSPTKSTAVPVADEDNAVNTADVFIFTDGGESSPGYGQLDTYRRFTGGLETMEITTTTGPKKICVVINADDPSFGQITDIEQLQEAVTELRNETFGNFTMYGEESITLDVQSSATVQVSRFISRIAVTSVKTSFAGTPYEGKTMTDCRLYLVNAHGDKFICDGSATDTPTVFNEGGPVSEDMAAMSQEGLLEDRIEETIGDGGYTTAHYLYCYSNETDDQASCTKLVLEAVMDGTTYYYPIPVNQTGYGYTESNGHFGIRRNTVYSYSITITRPGSLEPDTPVVPGTVEIGIAVDDWTVIPEFDKEF